MNRVYVDIVAALDTPTYLYSAVSNGSVVINQPRLRFLVAVTESWYEERRGIVIGKPAFLVCMIIARGDISALSGRRVTLVSAQ